MFFVCCSFFHLSSIFCRHLADGKLLQEPIAETRRSYLPFFSEAFVKVNVRDLFADYIELLAEAAMKLSLELRRAPGVDQSVALRSAWVQLTCRFGMKSFIFGFFSTACNNTNVPPHHR